MREDSEESHHRLSEELEELKATLLALQDEGSRDIEKLDQELEGVKREIAERQKQVNAHQVQGHQCFFFYKTTLEHRRRKCSPKVEFFRRVLGFSPGVLEFFAPYVSSIKI